MSGVPFQRLTATSGDEAARYTNQQQQNTEDALRQVFSQSPIADGVLLENVVFTASVATKLAHKLGRNPRGYLVVKTSALAFLNFNSSDRTYLEVTPTGPTTMNIWVF